MKTYFKLLTSLIGALSLPLTVSGCVFNQYVNKARAIIINKIAGQTANVIKGLWLAQQKNSDTDSTINDILANGDNYDIINQSEHHSIKSWTDFENFWGQNHNIVTENFTPDNLIVRHGEGNLTKTIQKYQQQQTVFKKLKLLNSATAINNSTLGGLLYDQGQIRNQVIDFLNDLKIVPTTNISSLSSTFTTMIKNTIIGSDWTHPARSALFETNLIEPLQQLFDILVDGWWDYNQPTPTNSEQLIDFMKYWIDENDTPYSNWVKNGSWSLNSSYYSNWTQQDYEFYRGGAMISHLFYQIGRDYQIAKPNSTYRNRYLGDIISDYIKLSPPGLDTTGLMTDLQQYLPNLLTNPRYLFDLINAIVPILKADIFDMPDITTGIKHLTIGTVNPTNYLKQTINFGSIFTNLINLLDNPKKIEQIVADMLLANKATKHQSFLIDIKITLINGFITMPLPAALGAFSAQTATDLSIQVANLLSSKQVLTIIKQIAKTYHQWVNFYDLKGVGFDFDLNQLITFLFGTIDNPMIGILNLFDREIVKKPGDDGWYDLITSQGSVTNHQYQVFFEGLGGQLAVAGNYPNNFRNGSILNRLLTALSDFQQPVSQLLTVILGNGNNQMPGILDEVTNEENQFIADNYTNYFDPDNKLLSHLSNIKIVTTIDNNTQFNFLSYNLSYRVDDKYYLFYIKGVYHENQGNNSGDIDFHFLEIRLIAPSF